MPIHIEWLRPAQFLVVAGSVLTCSTLPMMARLLSTSHSFRGFATNSCPLGVCPERLILPVPKAKRAAAPITLSTKGFRYQLSGSKRAAVFMVHRDPRFGQRNFPGS